MSIGKEFRKLSRLGVGRASHSHVVFLDNDRKEGLCSVNRNHSHPIQWVEPQPEVPEQPEQQDPNTGEIIPAQPYQEAVEGGWQVIPDPIDGHAHEMEEGEVERTDYAEKDKSTEQEKVSEVWQMWQEACGLESESMKKADQAEDFHFGDQWEATLSQRLKSEGRAVITKNFTQKYTDDLCGVVREEKKEPRYSPIEGGDKGVADLLTFVAKQIMEKNYYQRERAKVFEDMVIRGKGVWNLSVDFSSNLEGDVILERFPSRDVKFGPFEKEDLCDLEFLTKDKLYSIAKIKQLFPDKEEEVSSDFAAYAARFGQEDLTQPRYDAYGKAPNAVPVVWNNFKNIDVLRKEVRVVECWRKIYISSPVALSPERDFYFNCYGWDRKDIESVKTIPGFAVIERVLPKIRITKVAGNVLLSDENPAELPKDDFFIAPAYCKRRDNKYVGKVELAKDAQMEINKRASQAIDIGNKMATYVHYIDQSVFIDEKEEERFLQQSNSPGTVFRVNSVDRLPAKDEGSEFPNGIVQLMQLAKDDLREMLNTSVEPWGANTSGSALQAEQRKMLRGNQFLFDNLEFAEIRLFRLLIKVIQRYYNPQRIARMVLSAPGKNELEIDGTPISEFTEADIESMLMTADLDQYDVAVSEGSFSPTTRNLTNMILTDLAKSGYPIPPATIIRFSDLPKSEQDKVLKDIQAQQDSQGQEQSQTRKMEVEKSLVGQGIIPPSISEEYQLNQATFVGKASGQQQLQGGMGIGQGANQDNSEEEVEIRRDSDGVLRGRKRKVPAQQQANLSEEMQ